MIDKHAAAEQFADIQDLTPVAMTPTDIIRETLNGRQAVRKAPPLEMFQPGGIAVNDSFEQYLASDHISTSAVAKMALTTPLDFWFETESKAKKALEQYRDRSHFDLGTFVHEAILEPHRWDDIVVAPPASLASHEGCDTLLNFWADLLRRRGHNVDLPAADTKLADKKRYIDAWETTSGIRAVDGKTAIIVNELRTRWQNYCAGMWANIIPSGIIETSFYGEVAGLPMRCRPDALLFEEQIGLDAIVSVKTTSAPTIQQYLRSAGQFNYPLKEAGYQEIISKITGRDFSTTINVVLQTVEPYHVGVFIFPQDAMRRGRDRFIQGIEGIKESRLLGTYPGWETFADDMGLILIEEPANWNQ